MPISGQPYADFGTMNVAGRRAVHERRRPADGGRARRRTAAASARRWPQACEIEACDGAEPVGRLGERARRAGQRAGNGNSPTLTYNFGGAAAGIDYRLDPRFLVGIGAGYAAGNAVGQQLHGPRLDRHA